MNLQDAIWYDYHLYDLFHIDSGNKFDKSKMTTFDPTVNFEVDQVRTMVLLLVLIL